jgi:hypothetical protein
VHSSPSEANFEMSKAVLIFPIAVAFRARDLLRQRVQQDEDDDSSHFGDATLNNHSPLTPDHQATDISLRFGQSEHIVCVLTLSTGDVAAAVV